MKKILLLLLFSMELFASCLELGVTTGQSCSGNSVHADDINMNLSSSMQVSDQHKKVLEIPFYLYSDSNNAIKMTLNHISNLTNNTNETIDTTFYYVSRDGHELLLKEGEPFVLLSANQNGRNGSTKVGLIRIEVNGLSDTQTAGVYHLSSNLNVNIYNTTQSATGRLRAKGKVKQVSVIGFTNLTAYKQGKEFVDSKVTFGSLVANRINEEERDIFVKNNTNGEVQVKFETTPLIHEIHKEYKIDLNYFYTEDGKSENAIDSNKFFTITQGKKNGLKVGKMRFVTEKIDKPLVAGKYSATINATVRAK